MLVWAFHAVAWAEIPAEAWRYQRDLTRQAQFAFGLTAPVPELAAQIHQESRWHVEAVSPAGAQGLAQFMPATARWMPEIAPELSSPRPFDPRWSIHAMVLYMQWLTDRLEGVTPCHQWALALSAYNGGIGWLRRDQRLAAQHRVRTDRWFEGVELYNAGRSSPAFIENRRYPRLILGRWAMLYANAGWGVRLCSSD